MPDFLRQTLSTWLASIPSLTGTTEIDIHLLAHHIQAGEILLGALVPKPDRSLEQSLYAKSIHHSCRILRRQFMRQHADWLYSVLTNGRTLHKSLPELVFDAADHCPGLVPTLAQINEERTRIQANKEGYEIDQGIFFHALLSSSEIGTHLIQASLRPTTRAQELVKQFCRDARLDLGTVLIERRGCAAHITVNNAHCLNAEDDQLIEDMETAVDLALLDNAVRVCVLRGGVMTHPRYAGRRVFSAGINLKALGNGQISFVNFLLRRELGYINKIFRGLVLDDVSEICNGSYSKKTLEKPWIAAIDSFAIGGGAQLLLVFDRVIAASDSYFSLPAAQEGIVPGFANLRLHRLLGSRGARQVILFGRKIWANEPDVQLLVDEVVDSSEIDAAVEHSIQQLSSPAVIANRHMLNLMEEPLESFLSYAAEFALTQAERLYSQDVLDKVRAVQSSPTSYALK